MAINFTAKPAAPITSLTTTLTFFSTGYTSVDSSFVSPWKPFLLLPADGKFEGRPFTIRANGVTLVKAGSATPNFTISLAAGVTPAAGIPFRLDAAASYFAPASGNVVDSQLLALANNAGADESVPWMVEGEYYGDTASGTLNGITTFFIGASTAGTVVPPASALATRKIMVSTAMPTGLVFGPAALGASFQNYDSQKTGQKSLGAGPGFFPGGAQSQDPVIQFAIGVTFSTALATGSQSNLLNYALYE